MTGWYDDDNKKAESIDSDINDKLTLKAKWVAEADMCKLNFDINVDTTQTGYMFTGTMAPQKFIMGETQKLTTNGFSCTYTLGDGGTVYFLGWNTKLDGMGKAYANEGLFTYDGTVATLYAQWQKGSSGYITGTGSFCKLTYYPGSSCTGEDKTYSNLAWNNSPYPLGAVGTGEGEVSFAVPDGKTTFVGWRLKDDSDKLLFQPGDEITLYSDTIKVYAVWGYKVTFIPNGGTMTANTEQKVEEGKCATEPAVTQDNYKFLGWYKEDGTKFDFGTPITEDITLAAKWGAASSSTGSGGSSCVTIIKQPQDAIVGAGERTKLTVEAAGKNLNYQWYVNRNDGKGFVPCKNSCAPTYTLKTKAEQDGYRFCCRVYNDCGSVCTNIVTLTVNRTTLPKTGDRALTGLCLIMAVCCMGGAAMCLRGKKKKA